MAEKLFTQTELNKILTQRLRRERERMSRDFEKKLKRCMASVHLTIYQELCLLKKEIDPEWNDTILSDSETDEPLREDIISENSTNSASKERRKTE